MKKYDFLPSRPPFLQDFCKNAQWRAKKLRERGSNTARPTEKDGGGLPIGARPVDFGASIRRASCRFRRASCRFGASIRSRPVDSARRHHADTDDKTQKSPIPQSGDRAIWLLGVARFYASTNSSRKYMCKRSKRSTRSCASILHRDANVRPSAYCALYFTKHAHS